MKALSIRAPWWWWILHGGKDIENRQWKSNNPGLRFRGPVLIHASAWWKLSEVEEDFASALEMCGSRAPHDLLRHLNWRYIKDLGGHIVGQADVVDIVDKSESPWFVGRYGIVLQNIKPVDPWRCKGALGFFEARPL